MAHVQATVKLPLKQCYERKTQRYGVPLDGRHAWTIQPWLTWVYSMSVYTAVEFAGLFASQVFEWVDTTPDRWPMTDW